MNEYFFCQHVNVWLYAKCQVFIIKIRWSEHSFHIYVVIKSYTKRFICFAQDAFYSKYLQYISIKVDFVII